MQSNLDKNIETLPKKTAIVHSLNEDPANNPSPDQLNTCRDSSYLGNSFSTASRNSDQTLHRASD